MIRKLLLLFLVVLTTITTSAQVIPSEHGNPPDWKNVFTFGGNGKEIVIEMQKDTDGNLYVLGNFYGETTIGTETLSSEGGNSNIYLAKFDSDGILQWVTQSDAKVNGSVNAYQFQIHNDFIYLVGSFKFGDKLSGTVLSGNGTQNYFIARYTASGELSNMNEITFPDDSSVPKGTPRLSVDTSDGLALVAIGNNIYKSGDVGMSLVKSFDENLKLTDILYSNSSIIITGEITQTILIDAIQLDFVGGGIGLFYASLDQNKEAEWAYVTSYEQDVTIKASKLGRLLEKDNKIYLVGVTSGKATINNMAIPQVSNNERELFPFVVNINTSNGEINAIRAFEQDAYETYHTSVSNIDFWYNENEELTFLFESKKVTSLNNLTLSADLNGNIITEVRNNVNKSIYGLNNEELKSTINEEDLQLQITKLINNDEQWGIKFVSENGDDSDVVDLVSDKENYYYALISDGRKTNTTYTTKYTLIKGDYQNNIIWSKNITGEFTPASRIGESISFVDGVVALAGNVKGNLTIGDDTFISNDQSVETLFVAKFSESGSVINHTTVSPPNNEAYQFFDVASLDNNKIVVCQSTGVKTAKVTLFNDDLTINKTVTIEASSNAYVLDAIGGTNGKTFIVGELVGDTVTYEGEVFNKPGSDPTKNGNNIFFELDENFNFLNVFNYAHAAYPANYNSWPTSIISDSNDNKYVSGFSYGSKDFLFGDITPSFDSRPTRWNNYYAKIDKDNKFEWVQTLGSSNIIYNYSSLDLDEEGSLYLSFAYKGKLFINDVIELDTDYEGAYNSCVIKYNSAGDIQWVKTLASSSRSNTSGVAVKNNGEVALGGYFKSIGSFSEDIQLSGKGISKGFIAIVKGKEVLGTGENTILDEQMRLYPNPSKGNFTIDASLLNFNSREIYTQVFDVQGRLVYSKTRELTNNKLPLDLNRCSKGVYFVKMTDGVKKYTNKIILR
ncbi:T9SS type A sorting domain-containing protein [Tenacibaculum sp. nBUS_03]|uniref:T9SS type A sorting domain-containing protein n=1 Tax=Tenacibaculum sp. nBUS_03 TaxID=3395320 RepID=UPI003EC08AF5